MLNFDCLLSSAALNRHIQNLPGALKFFNPKALPAKAIPTKNSNLDHLLDLRQLVFANAPVSAHIIPGKIEGKLIAFKRSFDLALNREERVKQRLKV